MRRDRVTVTRGESEYEVAVRWTGSFSKATHLDPPEYPEAEPESATLNGKPVDLKAVPEDVLEEATAIASDASPDGEEDEPEPDDVHAGDMDPDFYAER